MAKPSTQVRILNHYKVSPTPNSIPSTIILPLTFLDIPWLFFSQNELLFFYDHPYSTSYFTSTTLSKLKTSLSLALQNFFPLAGNLSLYPEYEKPNIVFHKGDYVLLTTAESNGDFNYLTSDYPRDARGFHPLVPHLANRLSTDAEHTAPLLAVQVTTFPMNGICIGISYHHFASDARTFNNFIKTWATFCATQLHGSSILMVKPSPPLPFLDRAVIKDTNGLEMNFLTELWKRNDKFSQEIVIGTQTNVDLTNVVRATFLVTLVDMEKIKQWIITQCDKKNMPHPIHLSPYVLTCSFVWTCLVRTQKGQGGIDQPNYFGFIAGGMTRFGFPIPPSYLGNCVGFGRSKALKRELLGEDGMIVAANVIGNEIKKLDREVLVGAEKWISDWEVLFGSEVHIMISGSPKVDLYKTDFGFGRPKKIEDISIDKSRAISLTESREVKGGIEVGLALAKEQMDAFILIFNHGLMSLQ